MKRGKNSKNRIKVKSNKNRGEIIKDSRVKLLFGLFLIGFALFLFLAFISFLFTWKTDQSFEWSSAFSSSEIRVLNWSGKTGAYFSNLLINKWFGIASFFIPILLLLIGLRMLSFKILPVWKTVKTGLIAIILLSVILSYIFSDSGGYLGSGLGGGHGFLISNWLNAFLGKAGTGFLLLLLLTAFLIFSFSGIMHLFQRKEKVSDENPEITDFSDIISDRNSDETKLSKYNIGKEENELTTFQTKDIDKDQDDNEKGIKQTTDDIELTIEQRKSSEDEWSGEISSQPYDPALDLPSYKIPGTELLKDYESGNSRVTKDELISNKNKIVETLGNYNIEIDKIKATIGPTVTLYEIVPAPGIRISKIRNLEDDIALSLSALGIRIIAPIPGRGTIGIEVPNLNPEIVSMKSMLNSRKFRESEFELGVALGKTISNESYVFDLTKMPHLLIAGATGQGKSVGLNVIITSLLYKKHPSEIKFVMIDPKKVELTLFSKIERHFLAKLPNDEEPIITDTHKVINTLNSLTIEMDNRYDLLKLAHVRNIREYNSKFKSRKLNPEKGHRYLPYLVLVIDEFADLIMTAGKEIENPLARLAQMGRAVGLHLVIATQRPTTNIITGVIKANFPARIAFRVTSMVDSRTILDSPGANQLIGRGDMLLSPGSDLIRLQCAYLDTSEIDKITEYIGSQKGYPTALILPEYTDNRSDEPGETDLSKRDSYFEEAARLVVLHQQGSTSLIQRKLSIGYNRAGRIIDQLEAARIVGPFEGSKARQVLIPDEYTLEQFLRNLEQNEE